MVYGNVIYIILLYERWISGVNVEVKRNKNVVWLFGVVIDGKFVFVLIVIVIILNCLWLMILEVKVCFVLLM